MQKSSFFGIIKLRKKLNLRRLYHNQQICSTINFRRICRKNRCPEDDSVRLLDQIVESSGFTFISLFVFSHGQKKCNKPKNTIEDNDIC